MSGISACAEAAAHGVGFALAFNPVAGALTAAAAAFIVGARGVGKPRFAPAAVVLAAGWALGDGAAFAGAVASSAALQADGVAAAAMLGVWLCGSFALGYAVPAAIGAAVGRRVFFGTGRLAAASTALAASLAVGAIAGRLAL